MSLSDPCVIRSHGPSGEPVVRLGMPLVDEYLEFLEGRCRPNTCSPLLGRGDFEVAHLHHRAEGRCPAENSCANRDLLSVHAGLGLVIKTNQAGLFFDDASHEVLAEAMTWRGNLPFVTFASAWDHGLNQQSAPDPAAPRASAPTSVWADDDAGDDLQHHGRNPQSRGQPEQQRCE
jgi:hypothetical protein